MNTSLTPLKCFDSDQDYAVTFCARLDRKRKFLVRTNEWIRTQGSYPFSLT